MHSRASATIRSKKYGGLHFLQRRRIFFTANRAQSAAGILGNSIIY
jgi:hypothetical protein